MQLKHLSPMASPDGRFQDAPKAAALASPMREKLSKLHAKSLTDVPQRDDGGITLARFQTANVGSVYPHALGKLGL